MGQGVECIVGLGSPIPVYVSYIDTALLAEELEIGDGLAGVGPSLPVIGQIRLPLCQGIVGRPIGVVAELAVDRARVESILDEALLNHSDYRCFHGGILLDVNVPASVCRPAGPLAARLPASKTVIAKKVITARQKL
jgi:hypothetical protein